MKAVGIILIIVGILMMVFKGFNFEKEKSLVEIGDLEITATEKEHVSWSTYAGGGVLVLGAVVTIMGFRKDSKA